MHGTWVKAIKVLPAFSVVYKQDWYTRESYRTEGDVAESFLSRSYAGHFNERPYLRHRCFLYLTKTTRERPAAGATSAPCAGDTSSPRKSRTGMPW